MKLTVLLAALCASCTAITLAPERPKPQRANKALALRGGGHAQDICKSKFPAGSTGLFKDCFKASDGLLIVFLWGALYALGAMPDPIGKWMQENVFSKIYISDGKRMSRRARTPDWLVTLDSLTMPATLTVRALPWTVAYIRWEILFILGSLANTAVLMLTLDHSARVRRCAAVWGTTFILAITKFYFEHKEGWIDDGPYIGAQIFHILVALSCWYGVYQSLQ